MAKSRRSKRTKRLRRQTKLRRLKFGGLLGDAHPIPEIGTGRIFYGMNITKFSYTFFVSKDVPDNIIEEAFGEIIKDPTIQNPIYKIEVNGELKRVILNTKHYPDEDENEKFIEFLNEFQQSPIMQLSKIDYHGNGNKIWVYDLPNSDDIDANLSTDDPSELFYVKLAL